MVKAARKKIPHPAGNPLAVISLFISIVEAAFVYPVTHLQGANQTVFVFFMVGFPTLFLILFFLTVWFRPGHLFGPKDYLNEQHYLESIGRAAVTFRGAALEASSTARVPIGISSEGLSDAGDPPTGDIIGISE